MSLHQGPCERSRADDGPPPNRIFDMGQLMVFVPCCGMRPRGLAYDLMRCDREIATALDALLIGSIPILDALLWYTDWCRERELLLAGSEEISAREERGDLSGLKRAPLERHQAVIVCDSTQPAC